MRRVRLLQTKSLQRAHPWVYSGAIEPCELESGEIVLLTGSHGQFIATAYASPNAKVRLRVLEWGQASIDAAWWQKKLQHAWQLRTEIRKQSEAWRLVHGEADGLPGLIVDYYQGYLCLQAQTQGLEPHLPAIVQGLIAVANPKGIYERSDSPYRAMEGLAARSGLLWGQMPPSDGIWITEHGVNFCISLTQGQKSGHYCDQRDNRLKVARYAKEGRVLDLCCNTGGFTLQALAHGAKEVVAVDSSGPALERLKVNLQRSNSQASVQIIEGDIGDVMDQMIKQGQTFDCIILDPPKLAPQRSDMEKAQRAYKALNKRALQLLEPGGVLATFSCSAAMTPEHFQTVVAWAALEASCRLWRLEWLSQPIDHPVSLHFPESEYLKGLLVQRCH